MRRRSALAAAALVAATVSVAGVSRPAEAHTTLGATHSMSCASYTYNSTLSGYQAGWCSTSEALVAPGTNQVLQVDVYVATTTGTNGSNRYGLWLRDQAAPGTTVVSTWAGNMHLCVRWNDWSSANDGFTSCVPQSSLNSANVTMTGSAQSGAGGRFGSLSNTCGSGTSFSNFYRASCANGSLSRAHVPIGFFWSASTTGADMGAPPPPPDAVPTPELTCGQRMEVDSAGVVRATIAATVTNAHEDATDAFSIRLPWETDWRAGAKVENVALGAAESMPSGGWRVQCRVVRTLASGAAASGRWADGDEEVQQDCDASDQWQCPRDPTTGFVSPGALPTLPWIITRPHPTTAPTPAPTTVNPSPVPGTGGGSWITKGAGVVGAGIVGWLAGGAIASALDEPLGMDKTWMCRWNPGYRQLNGDACEQRTPYLRSQVLVQLSDGQVATAATATQWRTATAVAEVLLDTQRPTVGARMSVAVEDPAATPALEPRLTTTQETELDEATLQPAVTADDEGQDCPSGLGMLNPFNLGKVMRCVLRWAFVPQGPVWSELWAEVETEFPVTVAVDLHAAWSNVHDAVSAGKDSGAACPAIDTRDIGEAALEGVAGQEGRTNGVKVWLPTPAASGCPGHDGGARTEWQDTFGELFGYRETARQVQLFLLYFGVMVVVVRAFVSRRPEAVEPGGGE